TNPGAAEGDATLAEKLNLFFAHFEVEPAETATPHLMALSNLTLTVKESEVRCTLRSINPRKATGPDSIPGRVLKDCADQLAGIFTKIFNQSLALSTVQPCLKSSIIVPLPKKSHISSLSDYRPVALTPVVMTCFEKLVRSHITSLLPANFDSHQFAYRGNRSTEDSVATALHAALSHLEKQGSYVQMLFVDYCSAFNTILPHILVGKLEDLGLPHSTCMWINSFSFKPQSEVCGRHHSGGTYSRGDELAYRDEVERLSGWCKENNLLLNTTKTKELIIDYRSKETDITLLYISGDSVERVADFQFLGVQIEEGLTWSTNTSELLKKAQQRLYFLRALTKEQRRTTVHQAVQWLRGKC
ncbi:hypothetical protein QTP86_019168, partial [Hemibagrus guttatus]